MAREKLQVVLELISGQYKREAKQSASATGEITGQMGKADTATGNLGKRFSGLASTAKFAIAGAATAAVVGFAKDSISAATRLGESLNAVETIFGEAADTITGFGKISAEAVGLSTSQFQQMAAQTGQLLQGMGLDADDAASRTVQLTQRAADMASVMDTDVDQALGAIQSALQGQSEPIRKFIGSFSVAEVQAFAVEKGLLASGEAMDDNTKALASMEFILDRTNRLAGDFAQTSDELANSQRRAAAQAENASARFGEAAQAPGAFITNLGSDVLQGLQVMGVFGGTAREATLASLHLSGAIQHINEALREGEDPFNALASSLLHLAQNGDLTTEQFRGLAAAAGLSEDQFGDFGDAILAEAEAMGVPEEILKEMEEAIRGAGGAADEAAPKFSTIAGAMSGIPAEAAQFMADAGDAAGDAAPKIQSVADALHNVRTRMLEAADPAFAAVSAGGRLADAEAELADLESSGEATEEEIARAKLRVGELRGEFTLAQSELEGGFNKTVETLSALLGESKDEVVEILETVGVLDEQGEIIIPVVLQPTPASREIMHLLKHPIATAVDPRRPGMGAASARRHGGPIEAGRPYIVGESGREMIVPEQNGMVLSAAETRRLLSGVTEASGGDLNITLQGSGDVTADMGTVVSMAGVMRRIETSRR